MRTCSQPSRRKIGQSRSRNCTAMSHVPSEIHGVFARPANPMASCPTNMETLPRASKRPPPEAEHGEAGQQERERGEAIPREGGDFLHEQHPEAAGVCRARLVGIVGKTDRLVGPVAV